MKVNHFDEESLLVIQAIQKIIEWLESLLNESSIQLENHSAKAQRVFSNEECESLSLASRHYLMALEQQGILTPLLRERIIHHAMLLEVKNIELPVIEGIARILLGQQPEINNTVAYINKLMLRGNHSIH